MCIITVMVNTLDPHMPTRGSYDKCYHTIENAYYHDLWGWGVSTTILCSTTRAATVIL